MVIDHSITTIKRPCQGCKQYHAEIEMWAYTASDNILVCRNCAIQLSRKLLEDLCELAGDRHG